MIAMTARLVTKLLMPLDPEIESVEGKFLMAAVDVIQEHEKKSLETFKAMSALADELRLKDEEVISESPKLY